MLFFFHHPHFFYPFTLSNSGFLYCSVGRSGIVNYKRSPVAVFDIFRKVQTPYTRKVGN